MRPSHAASLALIGLCAAALSGCAGSSSPQPAGKIGGVGTAASPTAGASNSGPSATPSASASIPSDLNLDVVMTPTGDATKDFLLNDAKSLLYAYEQAIAKGDPADALYQTLVSGQAGSTLYSMIQNFSQVGQRPTGTLRFYDFSTKTSKLADDVLFCEDASSARTLTIKSGANSAPATGAAALTYWDIGFLNTSGQPTISYVGTQPGGDMCAQQ